VLVHVIAVAKLAVAVGGVVLPTTKTVFIATHKLFVFITVYVYTPAVFTVTVPVFPPETIPGPDQLIVVDVLVGTTIAKAVLVVHVKLVEDVEVISVGLMF